MSHWPSDAFRETLGSMYPSNGCALWDPSPGTLYDGVAVGDVGYIHEGRFLRLFNVLLPGNHPSHRNFGVPEGHKVLTLKAQEHIRQATDRTLEFCSRHVTLDSVEHDTHASPDDGPLVTVSNHGKRGGALFLPFPAQSEDTVSRRDFGRWMVQHIDQWLAFVQNLHLEINRMQDIILVTGCHRAKSWVNVAFSEGQRDTKVSFRVPRSEASGLGIKRQLVRGGAMLKPGPWDKSLPENQCIFLRGFRVVRILKIWPKLRGQAGPNPDIEDESEPDIVLEPIGASADTNYEDPLHVLLKYIAEVAPDCDMAVVHDDDLACIGGDSLDSLEPDVLMEHLRNSAPEIQKVQFDFLPTNASWSRAEEGITKIATLSKGAFSVPYVVEMGGGLFLHQIGLPMATTNESSASGSTRQRHRRAASVGDTRAHISPTRPEPSRVFEPPPSERSTGRRDYIENPMQRHEGAINASSSSATLVPVGLPRLPEGGGENSEIWERPLDFITRTTALSAASEPPTVFGGQARSSTRDRSNTIPVGASSVGSPRFAQPTRSPILAHPTYKLGPFSPRTLAVMEKVASDTNGLLQLAEDGTVSAGNLEGLVSRVIDRPADSSRDDRFGATFLTAYQLFSTSEHLFENLKRKFESTDLHPTDRGSQYSILAFIEAWLKKGFEDDHLVCSTKIRDFALAISGPQELKAMALEIVNILNHPSYVHLRKLEGIPWRRYHPVERPPGTRPSDVATALTAVMSSRFEKIVYWEYVNVARQRHNARHIESFDTAHKLVISWVQRSVLESSYLEERMKMYEEWVYISQVCLDMNDFSSTAAIVAALMSPMVSKLVLTCESKAKKRLLKLDRDLTPTNGAYQETLNQAETNNLIPWLGPHLSILKSTFAHFNPIVEVDGHPLIDFRLCRELAEQIDTLVQYSSPRADSETRQDVLEYVEYNIQSSSADNAASGVEARGAELAREEQAMLTQRERAQALGRPWLPHQDRLEMARRGEEDTVRSRETDRTRWDEEMVRRRAEEATRWREDMSRWGEGMARQREEDMARQREEDMARQREEDLARQREEATARQRMAQQRKEFELQIEKGVAQQFEDMTLRVEEDKARQREEVAAWPHEDVAQGRKGLGEGEATVRGHDETGTVQQREDTALRLKGDTSRRHEDDMLPRRGRLMSRVFGSKSGKKS